MNLEQLKEVARKLGVDPDAAAAPRVRPHADTGATVDNGAYSKSTHMNSDGRLTSRNRGKAALYERADAECSLIVALYFDGHSLSKIALMLGRNIDYVSRVFHSPKAQLLINEQKRNRNALAEELQDRTAHAAQAALDNIIELAQDSTNDSVRFKASEYLVDRAREDAGLSQRNTGTKIQVNISADMLTLAMQTIKEVDASPASQGFVPVEVEASST